MYLKKIISNTKYVKIFTVFSIKGYFHLCPRMDFRQTLHINNSL